ncbi:MAG TPA: helix-hairpin-helix domain-containing protein [Candidatus Polarisedimenticolia bacterium]|nr:helix-hairpin-helix domain-containing protein [Candidatus Polarisedimenticolia bacterium]
MKRTKVRTLGAIVILALIAWAALPPSAAAAAPDDKAVNINSAGLDELMSLPGIGKAYAERIIEYREKNGPFKKLEDLLNVRGIGEKTFQKLKPRLTLGKS